MEENYNNLKGVVETVIYKNSQNGYVVFEIISDGELIAALGNLGDIAVGEKLSLFGGYIDSQKYGRQFKAETCERMPPDSPDEIRRYLSSGVIKTLGPALAKKITDRFKENTLYIIENEPEKLVEINGINQERALFFHSEYKRISGVKSLIDFLGAFRINPQAAISVWQKYDIHGIEKIKKNPFILCEPGIDVDFMIADEIRYEYDIDSYDENRVRAVISYVLKENAFGGHTCLPFEMLKNTVCGQFDISHERFEIALENGIDDAAFASLTFGKKTRIYLAPNYSAERYIADKISLMLKMNTAVSKDYSAEIEKIEFTENIQYETLQKKAISACLTNSVFILTGGPGTGKTTTINAIIQLFKEKKKNLALAAPTGRAAKRMAELTGENAKTIHRLLEVDITRDNLLTFKKNELTPLIADVIIIDEMSMVDILLFEALLRAVKPDSKLVLVGDFNQLPSVGPGNVLKDLIDSGIIPSIQLKEIFRQAAESLIVTNAHKIVKGEIPDLDVRNKDFFFMPQENDIGIARLVIELTKIRLPNKYGFSSFDDIQVLSPTKKGDAGTKGLNRALQEALNPKSTQKKEIRYFDISFREGDKVMQNRNDYEIEWKRNGKKGKGIFNGDIGIITEINIPSGTLYINFDGRVAVYSSEMLTKLEHAYAITIHKSQGSEYNAVIIPLTDISKMLLYRNLLYTAVTRAKKILILVGKRSVVAEMVNYNREATRFSCIQGLLKAIQLKEKANGQI